MQLSSTFQWVNIPGNLKHIMDKIVGTDKLEDSGGRNRSKIKQKKFKKWPEEYIRRIEKTDICFTGYNLNCTLNVL